MEKDPNIMPEFDLTPRLTKAANFLKGLCTYFPPPIDPEKAYPSEYPKHPERRQQIEMTDEEATTLEGIIGHEVAFGHMPIEAAVNETTEELVERVLKGYCDGADEIRYGQQT